MTSARGEMCDAAMASLHCRNFQSHYREPERSIVRRPLQGLGDETE
jgi:hypothetical protein